MTTTKANCLPWAKIKVSSLSWVNTSVSLPNLNPKPQLPLIPRLSSIYRLWPPQILKTESRCSCTPKLWTTNPVHSSLVSNSNLPVSPSMTLQQLLNRGFQHKRLKLPLNLINQTWILSKCLTLWGQAIKLPRFTHKQIKLQRLAQLCLKVSNLLCPPSCSSLPNSNNSIVSGVNPPNSSLAPSSNQSHSHQCSLNPPSTTTLPISTYRTCSNKIKPLTKFKDLNWLQWQCYPLNRVTISSSSISSQVNRLINLTSSFQWLSPKIKLCKCQARPRHPSEMRWQTKIFSSCPVIHQKSSRNRSIPSSRFRGRTKPHKIWDNLLSLPIIAIHLIKWQSLKMANFLKMKTLL